MCTQNLTVSDSVYHTAGNNILRFGILSLWVVYRGGVVPVNTAPAVVKWVVVWDIISFTTPGAMSQGCDNKGGDKCGFERVLLPHPRPTSV